jgi:hypothetical protein
MQACECGTRETYYARMTFSDGQVHYREVCRSCGGNARGGAQNVGVRELRARGIDPDSLPDLPQEPKAQRTHAITPSGPQLKRLFDDGP